MDMGHAVSGRLSHAADSSHPAYPDLNRHADLPPAHVDGYTNAYLNVHPIAHHYADTGAARLPEAA
jgi:hypothetical protein